MVTWSVYTAYRKVFTHWRADSQTSSSTSLIRSSSLLPDKPFAKRKYLLKCLERSLDRAQRHYTKVYPHRDTQYLIYDSQRNPLKRATLDLKEVFSRLQAVGRQTKALKPKGSENIFVPTLAFVVSKSPHRENKDERDHQRVFIEVPLEVSQISSDYPLTCALSDGVFRSVEDYHQKDQKNVEKGLEIMGIPQQRRSEILRDAAKRACSERVVIEALHRPELLETLCQTLAEKLAPHGEGTYKIYSVALLAYSTNTVCQHCTPALLSLQNSQESTGFLGRLVDTLNAYKCSEASLEAMQKGIYFKTRGYDKERLQQDYSKFHLTTFVKADINCDAQADDLANKGQHQHKKCKHPPETHNPHAKLFFWDNRIDLHASPLEEGRSSPSTGFFYEFLEEQNFIALPPYVGEEERSLFSGTFFSSGSRSWVS